MKLFRFFRDENFGIWGQITVVALVVALLFLMILPVSPQVLDFFLSLNILGSLIVLMAAVFVTDPAQMTSFPSLVLLSTLFRMALNVGSTRLILSHGEGGKIIETFGYFVTSGNFAVGIIIFLVLMIIQFFVVTKGSERVAEVVARFTLDALPGKQMSIDADLRAGLITTEEAAHKRSEVIRESRIYGAMDGAMKFIKGDVLAMFCILFINILGGFGIGVFQNNLSMAESIRKYSLLTMGEGLVAIIPALFVSLASGFMVTRVSDPEGKKSLGAQVGADIFSKPRALLIVAVVAGLMAFVPGFPRSLFLFLFLGFGAFAGVLIFVARIREKTRDQQWAHQRPTQGVVTPFLLEFGSDLYEQIVRSESWQHGFDVIYPQLKVHLSHETGIPMPDIQIIANRGLKPDHFAIKFFEIKIIQKNLSQLVQGQLRSAQELLLRNIADELIAHASLFVGIQQVKDLLTQTEIHYPDLVSEVVPRMITLTKLTDVVKRLVDEGVSIKDFRLLLEILASNRSEERDACDLAELVRMGMKQALTQRFVKDNQRITCFCLDPEIEDEVSRHVQKTGEGLYIHLPPDRLTEICEAIKISYARHFASKRDVVILTEPSVRRYLRKIIETDLPEVSVLSWQELEPWVKPDVQDTISLSLLECHPARPI